MTRLRRALDGIAAEAPLVDLADSAIARHRRRRRATVSLAAVAVAATVAATGVVMTAPWRAVTQPAVQVVDPAGPGEDRTAPGEDRADVAPDLPDEPVGRLSHAYMPRCKAVPCDRDDEWRVVTTAGTTYRLQKAVARTAKGRSVPIAISKNGGVLAYYSREEQAYVVRDMQTGAEKVSPVKMPEKKIPVGALLLVSDDGRYLVVDDPMEFDDYPGAIIDMRTGERTALRGDFEPFILKDGVLQLVRYIKTDLWLMPVTGGGKPVRFDGRFIMFSEVAPDGRTVVALDKTPEPEEAPVLTVLDAKTGAIVRRLPTPTTSGGPEPLWWLDDREVVVKGHGKGTKMFALDVMTGDLRPLSDYGEDLLYLTLPGRVTK